MAIIIKDSFNRADGAIGVAETGQAWEANTANFVIVSNKASVSALDNAQWATISAGISDAKITTYLTGSSGTAYNDSPKLVFRFQDINNFWRITWLGATRGWELHTVVAGVTTVVGSSTLYGGASSTNIMKMTVICKGDNIKWYMNDVLVLEYVSSILNSAVRYGFGSQRVQGRIDDFLVESLVENPIVGTAHTKSLFDSVNTSDSVSKRFSAVVVDAITTGDSENERTTKALSDSLAITDSISKAISRIQADGISTGDSDSGAASKKIADVISITDIASTFGGKTVLLTDGLTLSDTIAKAISRSQADGIDLSESHSKQSAVSVRLYDVVISTDSLNATIPNMPEYREVLRIPINISTGQTVTVAISRREARELDVTQRSNIDLKM